MSNDSSTGGPILPNGPPAPAPLEGRALLQMMQPIFVGITGIDTNNVRATYQTETPNLPDTGTLAMSFSIIEREADTFPYFLHDPTANGGNGQDDYQQQEKLTVLCSFYDGQGAEGAAMGAAAQLRDGLKIPQNIEAFLTNQITLVSVGEIVPLPTLIKTLWSFRCDLKIYLNRLVSRAYPILNIESAQINLQTDDISNFEDVINVEP